MHTLENRKTARIPWAAALLGGFLCAGAALAEPTGSYGYLRVAEGPAAQLTSGSDQLEATLNQPLLRGDRLRIPERGRVETVLADGSLLRLDGGSEITFERLAGSADGDDRASVLSLTEGNLQLVVREDSRALDFPRIDTGNATIYIESYGVYRITADGAGWSEVAVRRGRARVVTDGDETTVDAGEKATVDGGEQSADIATGAAGRLDAIESWGSRLDDDARLAARGNLDAVEPDYRYEATSLASYGSWITVDSGRYWRPRVDSDWRPYWRGRWASTPSGLTWVSSDPWGWLPAHYGTWDFLPTYGWVWQPGYVYSPAWVYWYWGPSHVGWCPTGYYTRYYRSSFDIHLGFRSGIYGWAGGSWGDYDRWNFAPIDRFGSRDLYRYTRRGHDFGREGRHAVPRGIITTDTHGLTRDVWNKPQRVAEILGGRGRGDGDFGRNGRGGRDGNGRGGMARQVGDLPDVTSFVARRPLDPLVRSRIVIDKPDRRFDGTPLRPDSLGELPQRPGRSGRPGGVGTRDPLTPGVADGIRPGRGRGREAIDKPGFASGEDVRPADPLTPGRAGRPRRGEAEAPNAQQGTTDPTTWRNRGGDKPAFGSRRPSPSEDGGTPRAGRDGSTGEKPYTLPRGWREVPGSSGSGSAGGGETNSGHRGGRHYEAPDPPTSVQPGTTDRGGRRSEAPDKPAYVRPSEPDRGTREGWRREPSPSRPSYDPGTSSRRVEPSPSRPSYDPGASARRADPPPSDRPSSPPSSGARGSDEGKGRAREDGGGNRGGGGGGRSRPQGQDRKPPER